MASFNEKAMFSRAGANGLQNSQHYQASYLYDPAKRIREEAILRRLRKRRIRKALLGLALEMFIFFSAILAIYVLFEGLR